MRRLSLCLQGVLLCHWQFCILFHLEPADSSGHVWDVLDTIQYVRMHRTHSFSHRHTCSDRYFVYRLDTGFCSTNTGILINPLLYNSHRRRKNTSSTFIIVPTEILSILLTTENYFDQMRRNKLKIVHSRWLETFSALGKKKILVAGYVRVRPSSSSTNHIHLVPRTRGQIPTRVTLCIFKLLGRVIWHRATVGTSGSYSSTRVASNDPTISDSDSKSPKYISTDPH